MQKEDVWKSMEKDEQSKLIGDNMQKWLAEDKNRDYAFVQISNYPIGCIGSFRIMPYLLILKHLTAQKTYGKLLIETFEFKER